MEQANETSPGDSVLCPRGISRRLDVQQRSEEHTSELQSRENLVCRLLLEKKKLIELLPGDNKAQTYDCLRARIIWHSIDATQRPERSTHDRVQLRAINCTDCGISMI